MADDPLAFLKKEVSEGEQHVRVLAMERLRYVAFALSPDAAKRADRIEKELVPFLMEVCQDRVTHGNEELRHKIGMNLSCLAFMLEKDKVFCLLPICQLLCSEEEGNVRETGTISLKYISDMNPKLSDEFFQILKKLVAAEWFTARLSAVQLIPLIYPVLKEEDQAETVQIYLTMCNDEAPMVKRYAAAHFEHFFPVLSKDHIFTPVPGAEQSLMQMYISLATDSTQDSIRRSGIDGAVALTGVLSVEEQKQHVLGLLQSAAEDKSWRVRLKIAQRFPLLCKKMNPEQSGHFILTSFGNLLRDSEEEVRIVAANSISEGVPSLSSDQLQSIVPQLQGLAMDSSAHVRSALGKALGPLAQKLGRDITQKVLLPLVLDLFKDEYHEARLAVVQQAGLVCEVLGMDAIATVNSSMINALQVLIMDNQWRIRLAVVEQIGILAKQFGVEVFQSKFETVFLSSIDDSVFYVRMRAVEVLRKVAKIFGSTWTVEHLLPKILEHYNADTGFVMRVTVIRTMHKLADVLSPEQIMEHLFPVLIRGANDAVPSVRCQALETINMWMTDPNSGLTPEMLARNLRSDVQRLQNDTDSDVQIQVYQCLKLIEGA
jgi:serine/threonine-protein phosphatase 2A regulatory subunit A